MGVFQYLDWGIAGVLAVIIFLAYRNLVKQLRDDRKYMEDRLTGVITTYHDDSKQHTESAIKNTQVLTELITWLKARNGHK